MGGAHRLLGNPGGDRSWLAENGVRLEGSPIADYPRVLNGGVDEGGDALRSLFTVAARIDTEAALGWPGGTLYAGYQRLDGDNGVRDSGDFQVYSNIDESAFDAIHAVWYRQRLLDGRLRIKIGKLDANSEFAYVDNGGEFIHSSAGFSPTIQAFPSYPDPATSVNLFAHTGTGLYAGAGVYDGASQAGIATGGRGPSTFFAAAPTMRKAYTWFSTRPCTRRPKAVAAWECSSSTAGPIRRSAKSSTMPGQACRRTVRSPAAPGTPRA